MDTELRRTLRADPNVLFELAARVEDWPRILPHYRRVHVLQTRDRGRRLVEMAARRDVLGPFAIPLWWRAWQTLEPPTRIHFEHVAGISRGMRVQWQLALRDDGALEVTIRHVFWPRWPVPDWLVELVIGEYFVNGVARRTLTCLAARAQSATC
jgi:ribosome-associated toxin RatA of RatAB toxin-antitoxin module